MNKLLEECAIKSNGIKFIKVYMPFGMAFWTLLMPNTILLNKKYKDARLVKKVAHELVHRNQYKRDGIIRYLLIKICGRILQLFLGRGANPYEAEAYAEEDRIDMVQRGI